MLQEAGAVHSQPVGRQRRYKLTPQPLEEPLAWIETIARRWGRRLERLRDYLMEGEDPGE